MGRLPTFLILPSFFQSPNYSSSIPGKSSWVVGIPFSTQHLLIGWNIYPSKTRTLVSNHPCHSLLIRHELHDRKWRRPETTAPTQWPMHKKGLPLWDKWVTVSALSFRVGGQKIIPGRKANSLLSIKGVTLCIRNH